MTGIVRRATSLQGLRAAFVKLVDDEFIAQAVTLLTAFEIKPGSALDTALAALEMAAAQGEALDSAHPLVARVATEYIRHLMRAQRGIQPVAMRLTGSAARNAGQLARLITLGTGGQAALRLGWNVPSPAALAALMNYTASPVWATWVDRFAPGMATIIERIIIRDFAQGRSPIAAARNVRRAMINLPRASATRMLRTLQLTALRDGMALDYAANRDVLTGLIRIATFDNRVCPACIALHGSRLAVGERVDDHYNGRCVAVGEVIGRPRNIEPGADWLARQPVERVHAILGKAAGDAFLRGELDIADYVAHRVDPLFGRQVVSRKPV
jgi:hypothetical protein